MDHHQHQCGLEQGEFNPSAGCGYIWEHDNISFDGATDKEYDDVHMCPRCGKGPWKWRHWQHPRDGDLTQHEIEEATIALMLIRILLKATEKQVRDDV